jgi:hypothetical protein
VEEVVLLVMQGLEDKMVVLEEVALEHLKLAPEAQVQPILQEIRIHNLLLVQQLQLIPLAQPI